MRVSSWLSFGIQQPIGLVPMGIYDSQSSSLRQKHVDVPTELLVVLRAQECKHRYPRIVGPDRREDHVVEI